MSKRIVFFIVTALLRLVVILNFANPVSAGKPREVECFIPWMTADGYLLELVGQGKLVENGHGFDLTCDYTIDFTDPTIASLAQVCEWWGPGYCTPSGKNMVIQNMEWHFIYNGEDLWFADQFMLVKPDGEINLHAQFAPNQCSEYKGIDWTIEFPPGYWSEGDHYYDGYWQDAWGNIYTNTMTFTVDADAPVLHSQVRLGFYYIFPEGASTINPAQDTFMQLTAWWAGEYEYYGEIQHDGDFVTFAWDGEDPVQTTVGPYRNLCSEVNPAWMIRTYGFAR
jgi:hypothetical protein